MRRMRELPCAGEPGGSGGRICRGRAGRQSDGAVVELTLRVADEHIVAAAFRAYGCPHLIAAASWLAERLAGRTRVELEQWDWREVHDALSLPAAKIGRLLTLQDAARAAARNWPASAAV
jgi:NifU-like protein involved in Fe-S cluster formation